MFKLEYQKKIGTTLHQNANKKCVGIKHGNYILNVNTYRLEKYIMYLYLEISSQSSVF